MSPILSVTPTFIMSPDLPILPTSATALPSLAALPTFIISPDLPIMPTAVFPALGLTSAPSESSAAIPAATPSVIGEGSKGPHNIKIIFFACLFGAFIIGATMIAAALGWSRYKVHKAKDAAPKDEEAQGESSGSVETRIQAEISTSSKVRNDDDEKIPNVCDAAYTDDALESNSHMKNEENSSQSGEHEHEDSESSYASKRFTILAGLDISFSDAKESDSDIQNSVASLFSEDDRTSITAFASDRKRLSGSNWSAVQGVVLQRASFVRSATYTVEECGSHAEGFQADIIVHDITTCGSGQPQLLKSIPEADITEEGFAHMRADSEYNIDIIGMEGLVVDVVGDLLQSRPRAMPLVISTNRPQYTKTDFGEDAMSQLDRLVASLRGAKEEDFVLAFDDGESFEFPLPPMHIPTLNKTPAAGSTLPPFSCVPFESTQSSVTFRSEHTLTLGDVNNTPSVAFSPARKNTPPLSQDHIMSTAEAVSRLDRPLSMDFTVALNPNPPQKYAADFDAWCRERDEARAAAKVDPHPDCNDKIGDINSKEALSTCASDYSISALSEGQTEGTPPPIPSLFIIDATEYEQLAGRSQVDALSTTDKREHSSETDEITAVPSSAKTEPERTIPVIWQSHAAERPKASKPKHSSANPRGTSGARKNTATPNKPATALHPAPRKVTTSTQGIVNAESKPMRPLRPSRSLALVAPRTSLDNVELRMQQSGGRAVPVVGNALARQTLGGRPKPALSSAQSSAARVGPNPCTPKGAPLATTLVRGGAGAMNNLTRKTISSVPNSSVQPDRALRSTDTNVTIGLINPRDTLASKDSSASATIPKAKFFRNLATPTRHTLAGNQNVSPLPIEPVLPKVSSSLSKPVLTRQRKRDWTN